VDLRNTNASTALKQHCGKLAFVHEPFYPNFLSFPHDQRKQPWKDGKVIGTPQVALKLPFTFPLSYASGNAYDFSRDLSTIVYVRPGGHADLYRLSQK